MGRKSLKRDILDLQNFGHGPETYIIGSSFIPFRDENNRGINVT